MDWEQLYCHLSMSLGWTKATIDEMTLPEVSAFTKYWETAPPVHVMVASYLGIGGKKKAEASSDMGLLMQEAAMINGAQ